jgi:uncharacterized protein YndB with AHSA1/START domain
MGSGILLSLRMSVSPERVFQVFTGEIGRWWRPNGLFRLTRISPDVLAFEPGPGRRLIETSPTGEVFKVG